ncbi:MAG: MATE family efflux transporter [Candidatus Rhabdochlamydia sp.]
MSKITPTSDLTNSPLATFQQFVLIAMPLILLALSESVIKFTDRLCLSRYSIEALEANSCTLSLCALFQLPLLRIISIAQAFIAQYQADKQFHRMGSCIWQMIWISLIISTLSLGIIPLGVSYFLSPSPLHDLAIPYFYSLIPLNFLMPLTTALSAFYIGRGQVKQLLYLTFFSHAIFLILDPLLIWGIPAFLPPLGLQGSALAKLLSSLLLCILLFKRFLSPQNHLLYRTHDYQLNSALLWQYLTIGIPRSLSRIVLLFQWACVIRFLSLKGGDYLLAFSFGESIHFFFTFIVDGMSQAIISIGAYLAALRQKELIIKFQKIVIYFTLLAACLLCIPYVLFKEALIHFMLPYPLSSHTHHILSQCCLFSLLFFIAQSLNSLAHNLLTAFYDTLFQLFYNMIFSWIAVYYCFVIAIETGWCRPDQLWLLSSLSLSIPSIVYFIRMRKFTHPKVTSSVSSQ